MPQPGSLLSSRAFPGRACSLGSGLRAPSSVVGRLVGREVAEGTAGLLWVVQHPGRGPFMLGNLSRAQHPALPCSGSHSVHHSLVSVWQACGQLTVLAAG